MKICKIQKFEVCDDHVQQLFILEAEVHCKYIVIIIELSRVENWRSYAADATRQGDYTNETATRRVVVYLEK